MEHGFKAWCEEQAAYWRAQLDLQPHQRLEADKLADHLEVELINPNELTDLAPKHLHRLVQTDWKSWSAFTIVAEGITVVLNNPRHSSARREANIMHELGHVIRKHKPSRLITVPWFPFPLREFDKNAEEEATWFGGCLQIPRAGLEWALARRMQPDEIAVHFGASKEMVRYRRNSTGIDRQYKRYSN